MTLTPCSYKKAKIEILSAFGHLPKIKGQFLVVLVK